MDWLRRATGAIGNLFNQGSRYVGNTFNNVNRQRQQWQQQVQRQAPQVQRQVQQQFQQVQRQIPKPPPTPQVDFSAVIANLQKLRSQPQVQRMAQAANPVNQFKQQANALQKQVINPLNQFGQNQVNRAMGGIKVAQNANQQALQNPIVKTALNVPFSNPVSAYNALSNPRKTFNDTRGAREMFFGKTGELANTVKSLPAGINVLALAPYEIAGQKLGIKPLEQRAKKLRLQQYADYAKQSQQGINPVGSQQQRDIDAGGVKGLKAFTGTMLNKGAGAGLEIAPVVTGAAVTAPLKSTLLKGGTLGAAGNVGYSGVSGYYSPNRSAQEKALQFVTDVAGGYGGELLGYGGSKAIQRIASKPVAKGFTGNLIDQANTRFRKGQINEKQYRAFLVDNFEQQFKRKPMPAEIDGYIDVAKNSYNRPYVEAVRARIQAQASGQPQLPVQAQRIAQDVPNDPLEALKAEARKYKSADEFVNSKANMYHGSQQPLEKLDFNRTALGNEIPYGVHFTQDKDLASDFASGATKGKPTGSKGIVNSASVDVKNPLDTTKIVYKQGSKEYQVLKEIADKSGLKGMEKPYSSKVGFLSEPGNLQDSIAIDSKLVLDNANPKIVKQVLLDNGYDPAIRYKMLGTKDPLGGGVPTYTDAIAVLDKSAVKTKQQLTDLYNQANTPQVGKTPKGNEGIYPKSYENFVNKNRESAKPFDYDLMASIGSTPEVRGDKVKVYRMVSGGGGKLQPNDNVSIYDFRKLSPEVQRKMGVQDVVANKKSKMVEQWINKDELYQAETGTQIYRPTTPAQVGKTGKPIYELAPKPSKTPEVSDAKLPIKQSGIGKTLEKSGVDIYDDIPGYVPVKNKALLNISENRVANNEQEVIASIVNRQSNQPVTPQMNSDAVYLLNKLLKEGRDEEALAIAKATAKNATSAGRAVQILSRLQQTTPSGALVKAQKIVNEVNAKAGKQVASLDAVKQKDIIALANEVQKHKVGTREWEVSAGKLLKYMENLKPVGTGTKVGMIQTMAQLLNPKTAIRNIVGNVGMNVGEDVASVPAALLDRIVSKGTGIRTTTISNPIVGIKGAAKGIKYGIEDTNLGIKTLGGASKFDVRPDVFKKGVMKKLQTALGYELGVPDKAFYQSAFDKTLDSVMRANKTKTPTKEMLDIANSEALYATFQNNSKIAQGLQKAKSILNAGQEFGAGDFIIKYPKTPGNIVSTGLDYSPVGMAKGIASLANNFSKMTPAVQREAVRNIGRGITGTGAIALGYTLAKNGIITGRKDADKDIAALDREQGIGPFSFNVTALQRFVKGEDTRPRPGDVVANYDWLQPAAIQLSMGANAVINAGKGTDNRLGDLAESIGDSTNTIIEQPVLQGISQFVNNMNTKQGGGLGKALSGVVSGIPSSFVPGSVNQLGQMFDNTARNTYSPRTDFFLPTGEMFNKTIARIPVLRERLQPSVTTLGQPREQYQDGGNNIFNVFFNPAFIKRIKDNEVYDLVKDIQDRSGETQQAPRVVDKKIKINGQDKQLTPDEYTRYQTYVGQKTNQAFSQLAKDPKFLQLSDADKASYMAKKMTAINAAAKAELFGNQDIGSDAQDVIGGRLGYETAEDKRNRNRKPKVAKAPKAKKPKKGRTARARKGRAVRVAKVPSVRISAPRKIAVGKVAKLRAPRIKYPKLAKSSKMPKIKV